MGVLEAVTDAISSQLEDLAGWRFTRLTGQVVQGVATFPLETTLGWPAAGTFVAEGTVYSYSSLGPFQVSGVTWMDGATVKTGAKKTHAAGVHVLDFSRTFSTLDLTRGQFLVGAAVGTALDAVGRNLGVRRPPNLPSDEDFRRVVKSLAYLPKGTLYGLELALNAFFGPGNWRMWENFPTSRNTVFVQLLNGVPFPDANRRGAYYERRERRPLAGSVVTVTHPLVGVQGCRLAGEDGDQDFRLDIAKRPSAYTEIRYTGDAGAPVWTYGGTSEFTKVLMSSWAGACLFNSGGATAYYYRKARVLPSSRAAFSLTALPQVLPSTTDARQFSFGIHDGSNAILAGIAGPLPGLVGFIDAAGAFLAGSVAIPSAGAELGIRKDGTSVELLLDGRVVQTAVTSAFPASALNQFWWGEPVAALATQVYVPRVSYWAETDMDFWNDRGKMGQTNTAAPTSFDTLAWIIPADVGKTFTTYSAAVPQNRGRWKVATAPSTHLVTLIGRTQLGAYVDPATPGRIFVAEGLAPPFTYPDDIGKKITIQTGPNAGTWTITQLWGNHGELLSTVDGNPGPGAVSCSVSGAPAWTPETGLAWNLVPAFLTAAGMSWELSSAGEVAGSNLTLRTPPVLDSAQIVMEPVYSQVLSSQLVRDQDVPGAAYRPAYLPQHPWGPYAAYLKELTVAGVIPELITST